MDIDSELKAIKRLSYDIVVVGAGGAGLRAAIGAAAGGASVGLICKSLLGKAHTVMAEGGVAAALANVDSRDSWKVHFRDTMKGGGMHNHWRMVELHAKLSPDRVNELERWGAVFDRTKDGKISQRNFGGHTYPRLAHVGDRTGLEMIRTLQEKLIHEKNVTIHMETTITRLFTSNGLISGAFGYDRQTGNLLVFQAKAVILATGGIGKAYLVTSNSWEYTGDGITLALDTGAQLIDMEFLQFHPTGMLSPSSVKGILVTEGVRGEGGVLKNAIGERFMFNYIPERYKSEFAVTEKEAREWLEEQENDETKKQRAAARKPAPRRPPELLTRDVVSKAINAEVKAGRGSPHGGVFLDVASQRDPEYIKRKLPSMYHQFMTLGKLDITKEPMEVGPTTHYIMGGIRVDADTQMSSMPGLFAAGEVAAGMHGANRLGGNSLSDLLVFGALAGESAAKYVKTKTTGSPVPDPDIRQAIAAVLSPFGSDRSENPYALHSELQRAMDRFAGIIRTEKDLLMAKEKLQSLADRAAKSKATGNRIYNPGWHLAIDIQNLLMTSQALVLAALERKESRGAHTREDYPKTEPELAEILYVIHRKKPGDPITILKEKIPSMPAELKSILEELK